MIDQKEIKIIKSAIEEFFSKMTFNIQQIDVGFASPEKLVKNFSHIEGLDIGIKKEPLPEISEDKEQRNNKESVEINIKLEEPQVLIGEKGQTLLEIQRLLKIILNKKLKKIFYLNIDINNYKKKKAEYLKDLARDLANEVAFSKEEKVLLPMSSFERRIIHAELSQRNDVATESRGQEPERYIVIKPK
jgi:spoIIIJ-associated protein